MDRSRRGLAVLGACGLIVGLIALSSSAVQAEKGANWMVNGTAVTGALTPGVSMVEVTTKDMTLLSKVLGIKVELLCEGATFIGAKLEPEGKVGGGNKVKFGGCTIKLNGAENAECTPHTAGEPAGTLLSTSLKGLMLLTGVKETAVLFEPEAGTAFLTLEFSGACPIGSKCVISGKNSIKESNGQWGVELVKHPVEQGPIAELFIAGNPAVVDGVGVLALNGVHTGLKWSGIPG